MLREIALTCPHYQCLEFYLGNYGHVTVICRNFVIPEAIGLGEAIRRDVGPFGRGLIEYVS